MLFGHPWYEIVALVALIALVFEIVRNPTSAVTTYLRMQFLKAIGWVERETPVVITTVEKDSVALLAAIEGLFKKHVPTVDAIKTAFPSAPPGAIPEKPVSLPLPPAPPVAVPILPPLYLLAEQNARPELDRPDHTSLAALLSTTVEAAGRLVATTPDSVNLALREALIRAARILDPNTYVPISMFNGTAIVAALNGSCPVMRRFAASQLFIATIGDRSDGTVGPMPVVDFSTLPPDGAINYVPYDPNSKANVTIESVSKAEAPAAP